MAKEEGERSRVPRRRVLAAAVLGGTYALLRSSSGPLSIGGTATGQSDADVEAQTRKDEGADIAYPLNTNGAPVRATASRAPDSGTLQIFIAPDHGITFAPGVKGAGVLALSSDRRGTVLGRNGIEPSARGGQNHIRLQINAHALPTAQQLALALEKETGWLVLCEFTASQMTIAGGGLLDVLPPEGPDTTVQFQPTRPRKEGAEILLG